MTTLTLTCKHLLLDASAAISLFASRRMGEIIAALPVKVAVIDITRQQEIKYIWGGSEPNVHECKEAINLQPLIDRGLILEIELDDAEYVTMVNLAALRLENGESAATAVAFHRGWGVCIDDFRALPRLQQFAPQVPFVATSQLLQHWATVKNPMEVDLRATIQSMQQRGGFGRSTREPLTAWLRPYLDI
jgi:predicted nucleic acid-binding protein